MTLRIRTYGDLREPDGSDLPGQIRAQLDRVRAQLASVRSIVAVMSGKGGVGKSFVAAGLASAFARAERSVGLLDADLEGPSARRLLGLPRRSLGVRENGVQPAIGRAGVALFSTDLLLEEGRPLVWRGPASESFVWRGALERGTLREFLSDVVWGERDLLVVDLPPGSQRLVDLTELVPSISGVIAVTLPAAVSGSSVERSLEVARRRAVPVLGVVENMSGVVCASCGEVGPLFSGEEGVRLADRFRVPLLGRVPFDPRAARWADAGEMEALLDRTAAGSVLKEAALALLSRVEKGT